MAGEQATLNVHLKLTTAGFESGSNRAAGAAGKLGDGLSDVERRRKRLSGGLVNLKTVLAAVGFAAAVVAIKKLSSSFLDASTTAEGYQVRLTALLGSATEGARLFDELAISASKLPFELEEIMAGSALLAGVLTGGVEEITAWIPLIADLATVSGLSIQVTSEQIQRMLGSGAGAADLFRDRGILAMLGFQSRVEMTANQTREVMIAAWEDSESKFREASEAMANTWQGQMSMMKDAWFNFRRAFMDAGLFELLKGINLQFIALVQSERFQAFAIEAGAALFDIARSLLDLLRAFSPGVATFGNIFATLVEIVAAGVAGTLKEMLAGVRAMRALSTLPGAWLLGLSNLPIEKMVAIETFFEGTIQAIEGFAAGVRRLADAVGDFDLEGGGLSSRNVEELAAAMRSGAISADSLTEALSEDDGLGGALERIAKRAGEIEKLNSALREMADIPAEIISSASDIEDAYGSIGKAAAERIVDEMSTGFDSIKQLVLLSSGETSEVVEETLKGGAAAVSVTTSKMGESWAETAQLMSQAFGHAFDSIDKGIGDLINGAIQLVAIFQKMRQDNASGLGGALAGAGLGSGIGGLLQTDQNQAQLGGTVGGAIGGFFGPAGAAIGGVLGSVLGSLIKKSIPHAELILQADGSGAIASGSRKLGETLGEMGDQIVDTIQELVSDLGGSITGGGALDIRIKGDIITVMGQTFEDLNEAIEFAVLKGLSLIDIEGLSKNVSAVLSNAGRATSVGELQQGLQIATQLDTSMLSKVEAQLAAINRQYASQAELAERLGIDLRQLEEARRAEIRVIGEQLSGSLAALLPGYNAQYESLLRLIEATDDYNQNLESAVEQTIKATTELSEQTQGYVNLLLANVEQLGANQALDNWREQILVLQTQMEAVGDPLGVFAVLIHELSDALAIVEDALDEFSDVAQVSAEEISKAAQAVSQSIEANVIDKLLSVIENEELAARLQQIRTEVDVAWLRAQVEILAEMGFLSEAALQVIRDAMAEFAELSNPAVATAPTDGSAEPPTPEEILAGAEAMAEFNDELRALLPGFDAGIERLLEMAENIDDFVEQMEALGLDAAESVELLNAAIAVASLRLEQGLIANILSYIDNEELALRLREIEGILAVAQMRAQLQMLIALGQLTQDQIDLINEAINQVEIVMADLDLTGSGGGGGGGGRRGGGGRAQAAADEAKRNMKDLRDFLFGLGPNGTNPLGGLSQGALLENALKAFLHVIGPGGAKSGAVLDAARVAMDALQAFTGGSGALYFRTLQQIQAGIRKSLGISKDGDADLLVQLKASALGTRGPTGDFVSSEGKDSNRQLSDSIRASDQARADMFAVDQEERSRRRSLDEEWMQDQRDHAQAIRRLARAIEESD